MHYYMANFDQEKRSLAQRRVIGFSSLNWSYSVVIELDSQHELEEWNYVVEFKGLGENQ